MKVAIVGAGKLGIKITEALLGGDHSVLIIDKNEALLQKLGSQMDLMTVAGNAKQISLLENIGIDSYDFLISATNSDEKNIVICSFAKKLGCKKVIARVRDPEHMNQLDFIKDTMDIDYIVNPDLSITIEIYKFLVEKYTLSNGIFSSGKISLIEFLSDKMPELIDKKISEITGILINMLVVAISRNGKVIIPKKDTVIIKEDILYVVGAKNPIMKLNAKVHEKGKYTNLQKVMIIGGGKTGLYLAQKLSEFGVSVKIIEKEKARCQYLSAHLDDVLVLYGDATDLNLLEEENIDEMDAVVTATGFDEENLLLALMAKKHGIEDVIAKVSRESYASLIESMGIDMALNPLDMTASHILRFIQGSKRVISSQLIQGQAEVIEIIADEHMKLTGKPISHLDLPDGAIIAAIHRGTDVVMPNESTEIENNDRVIIICLLSDIPVLEKLLRSGRTGFFK
ncbi:Trk system potassium transporter TrkA [Sinanaerobacter chloroacetimidivorans]|jgi:trk system potassium uptake protein TrkA|uniref:Trk system potassium uptake protein TrkA n=1 Tax=Sinanaerobacter chloroacetimidivorans TaxID=2818044 RepID=A0A8J7W711_9FIRM|nr:Trk system potassium transporter TrkA [Sinanaerobacter chloroacetimidivorans]MBR0600243.1 Trk system potassium transporter TrkA [Sinanaerobacter chloroacetimidivorans]